MQTQKVILVGTSNPPAEVIHLPNQEKPRFSMALTGDSFITTRISCYNEADFTELFDLIRNQDFGFTNLEVLLNDYKGIPAAESGGTYAGAPTALAKEIKWAGFHMVSRANNHSLDYSYEGLRITSRTLDEHGISHAGVGETLAEARSPAYMDFPFGRVALLSASSTFASWGRAGDSRPDFQGRPGLSPLRYVTKYHVTAEQINSLRQIESALGLRQIKERLKASGFAKPEEDTEFSFLGLQFVESDVPGIHSEPNEKDVREIVKWIKDARRQADWVLFSLHAHEAQLERELPAEFIVTFARKCIDAGVDIFIGHGPHVLRGIEIYKGKPIFYSLGNFIFQNDLVYKHPQEIYDRYSLPLDATPADIYDTRSKNDTVGFPSDPAYWESVLAVVVFEERSPKRIDLFPLTLGFGKPRPQRGRPFLARGEEAVRILRRLQGLSEPFGTAIEIEGEKGIIRI